MMRFNQVVIAGRLVKDPEFRSTANGTSICKMRLAYDQGSGDTKKTGYVDVTAFQKTAEAAHKHLKKGSGALIGGRLEYEEWEKDGQKRNKIGVIAHEVQFTDARKGEADEHNSNGGGRDPGW